MTARSTRKRQASRQRTKTVTPPPPTDWLVYDAKGHLWWKPGGNGYTRTLADAGRFTQSAAIRHQMSSDLTSDRHDVAIPLCAVTETR